MPIRVWAAGLAPQPVSTVARLHVSVQRKPGKGVESMVASGVVVCEPGMW
jgi:hypothetical protein